MSYSDIPILVVDDAKFSSAIIAKVLRSGGFSNVRFTNNPLEALRSLEKRSAQILLADWMMPSMDGIELTRRVKAMDAKTGNFTYVMLMTARDDFDALKDAFDGGVDDFIGKGMLRDQLLGRIVAANAVASRTNDLLKETRLLSRRIEEAHITDVIDPVTGLGNRRFTQERLAAMLTQSETRGGTACLLLVGLNNLQEIEDQFEVGSIDELLCGMANKIRSLVRPLDLVTRTGKSGFAVLTMQESIKSCTSDSFKRMFDNLYMHSFKTTQGYIPVVVGVSITAADRTTGYPGGEELLHFAEAGLNKSYETGTIQAGSFDPAILMEMQ
ncbi:MAG: response regulator [Pseudomonadota bacterium]